MKICFFNDIHILGGGELWVLKACQQLRALGHEPHVICPWRSGLYQECLRTGIPLFSYTRGAGVPFYEPVFYYLKKNDIDLIYCTVIGQFNEAAVLGTMASQLNKERAREKQLAVILKTGLPPMGISPRHYGYGVGPHVPRLHVVSESVRQAFLDWHPKFGAAFVRTVREGVDITKFNNQHIDRQEAKAHWNIPAGYRVVTSLARLHPLKGQDNLLLAVPEILQAFPNTVFLFAGEGEDLQRLKAMASQLGVEGAVRFLGHVTDVPFLLAASDLLCHPSLADGMPNSIVEAMVMEIPVVASNVGGIADLVKDEETGLLLPPHDIKEISHAVIRLFEDEALRERLCRNGKQAVREQFDFHQNTQLLLTEFTHELATLRSTRPAEAPQANRRVSIMFLMNTLRTGGEESEVAILAKYLDRRKYDLSVLSLFATDEPSPATGKILAAGVPIDVNCHELPEWNDKGGYVINRIKNEGIGIVIACQDPAFAHQVFDHLPGNQHLLIEHGGIVGEAERTSKEHTFRYLGVSSAIRDAAAKMMAHPEHARWLPSMVDTKEYEEKDGPTLRAAYGFPASATVVSFVGRLDPKKRVEQLIDAARELLPAIPELYFLVVGGHDAYQPDYAQRLRGLAADLSDHNRFLFVGDRGDVPELLTASDILVLPSAGEGMSHVINEAGAAGLAVIATRDGAAAEQLDHGHAGVLIEVDDVEGLTRAIATLALDPTTRDQLGKRLRARVTNEYSAEKIVPEWEKLFAEATAALPDAHEFYISRLDGFSDFPLEIQIQTTTLCNATCVMCPYPEVSQEFPVGKMDEKLYRKILEECAREPTLRRIEPFLMNEAFIDKRIPELIKLTKQLVPHAAVTVTTNGTPLVPRVTDKLIASGLDAIWFSFNGATPETYEKIMGIPYAKVKSNIEYLLATKPEQLQVYVNMIETLPMAAEIQDNIAYWKTLGIQAGSSPLVNRGGNLKNFEELNYQAISEVPVRTCELVFYKMYILYNGDAILCCMDWRRNVVLGNVYHQSIREIWNGEVYREVRRKHIEGRDGEINLCGNCSYTLN